MTELIDDQVVAPGPDHEASRSDNLGRLAAIGASLLLVVKAPGFSLTPVGALIGAPLAPVTIPVLLKANRRFRMLVVLLPLAVLSGLATMAFSISKGIEPPSLFNAASVVVWAASLLLLPALGTYAALHLGLPRTLATAGLVALLIGGASGVIVSWKGDVGIYAVIVGLALTYRLNPLFGRAVLVFSIAACGVSDARSQAIFSIFALAATFWPAGGAKSVREVRSVVATVIIGIAAVRFIYFLIERGVLGEEAAQRTVDQAARGVNPLIGARVEWSAAGAVLNDSPLGYGISVSPPNGTKLDALSAVHSVGGDYTAPYFTESVLGDRPDFHSSFIDLWFHFGLLGVAVSAAIVWILLTAIPRALRADGMMRALMVYTLTVAVWDFFFSPMANIDRLSTGLVTAAVLGASVVVGGATSSAPTDPPPRPHGARPPRRRRAHLSR